jgi:hypothetical protein
MLYVRACILLGFGVLVIAIVKNLRVAGNVREYSIFATHWLKQQCCLSAPYCSLDQNEIIERVPKNSTCSDNRSTSYYLNT